MTLYVVGCCVPLVCENELCVTVETDDGPEEAALEGMKAIEEREGENCDPDYCETVFVAPVNVEEAMTFRRTAGVERVRGEYECCGGGRYTEDGHAANRMCPRHREEETATT